MIQMKDMLNLFPKIPLYFNFPSKHAKEKCLNANFLTAGCLFQKKMPGLFLQLLYFYFLCQFMGVMANKTKHLGMFFWGHPDPDRAKDYVCL